MTDIFSKENDRKKKKKVIVISAIAVAAVIILLLLRSCSGDTSVDASYTYEKDKNSTYGSLTSLSKDEIVKDLNEKVEEGMMNISMNLCPVFEDGDSAGNLFIYNDPVNRYPQIVEIYTRDTGRLLYRSGGIDVGCKIEYATLDVSLDKGVYECTAYFTSIDETSGNQLGKAGAEIVITVLN